jgi:hypothetical protein
MIAILKNKKPIIFTISAIMLAIVLLSSIYFFKNRKVDSLESNLEKYGTAGQQVVDDLNKMGQITPVKAEGGFEVSDDMKDGVDIQFASQPKKEEATAEKTKVIFPDSLEKPMMISLPMGKSISITDKNGNGQMSLLGNAIKTVESSEQPIAEKKNMPTAEQLKNFVQYQSSDKRKNSYFAYQKDVTTGERKLKNWTLYASGNGKESEAYEFSNAKISIDQDGNAKVFFDDGKAAQNQQVMAEVDQGLLARAQKAILKDAGTDIMAKDSTATPDFIVPRPYYFDSSGQLVDLVWKVDEKGTTISVDFEVKNEQYPIAFDPTLQFVAPGQSNTASVITGDLPSDYLGYYMLAGDFNADGRTDLAVGVNGVDFVYIFYNDGLLASKANFADVKIKGEAGSYFGRYMAAGDLNNDGKTDIAIGAYTAGGSAKGRVYIFYNDGIYPANVTAADVIITGNVNDNLGSSLIIGDVNSDGKADLIVGASRFSTWTGRVYIFYGNGTNNFGTAVCSGSPAACLAANANVVIDGTASWDYVGSSLAIGDFNADGKNDLALGSNGINNVYIFYGDGTSNFGTATCSGSPAACSSANADVIIAAESGAGLGQTIVAGDFNADGKTDLAMTSLYYGSSAGRVYILYGSTTLAASIGAGSANVIITGEASSNAFGWSLAAGDFNADGKTDLAVGANTYLSSTGRVYIFYNDGSIPTTAATADVIITGEATSNEFGYSLTAGDFNGDGKIDLAVGATGYSSYTGRTYIFYSQNGQVNTNKKITGSVYSMVAGDFNSDGKTDLATGDGLGFVYIYYNDGSYPASSASADVTIYGGNSFGGSMGAGDFNNDGRTDLVVGDQSYSSYAGGVFIFYNDGLPYAANASGADFTITGEAGSYFGYGNSITTGDFNADGKIDLAVGGWVYSGQTGRAYVFYNGSMSATAATANVIITGTSGAAFGITLVSGDFNNDGKTDLVVGASRNGNGKVHIFYADGTNNFGTAVCTGTSPTLCAADNADVIITGELSSSYFGLKMAVGDFNSDGKTDLAVGSEYYNSGIGRAYIIYNDGLPYPTLAVNADVIITAESGNTNFGVSMIAGDFNADGRTDLAIGASIYASSTGRVYIFYNDGSIPTTAAAADIILTGQTTNARFGDNMAVGDFNSDGKIDLAIAESQTSGVVYIYETRDAYAWQIQKNQNPNRISGAMGQEMTITGKTSTNFGASMVAGDFNFDGKIDLAVGANSGSSVYIFYNDGAMTNLASDADLIINGVGGSAFGISLAVGDFNADGRTDLAVGARNFNSAQGQVYIFYNDGSIPTTSSTADVIITGETSSYFGESMTTGDFNNDGRTDLAVGSQVYTTNTGRVYILYGSSSLSASVVATSLDVVITGETTNNFFGCSLAAGDFNTDGKTDLAVGAYGYSANLGRTYIFYNGNIVTKNAAVADVIISAEALTTYFGRSLAAGDFNSDGKTDLAVEGNYSSNKGRIYIFYADGTNNFGTAACTGSAPTTCLAANGDVLITGSVINTVLGQNISAGDFNADGKTDLIASGRFSAATITSVYIFYNDGAYPASEATADATITAEQNYSDLGKAFVSGDFNNDGKNDLALSSPFYGPSNNGKVYIYTSNEAKAIGEATSNFGIAMTTGDFNADGKIDLAVGATGYLTSSGRVYVFYNDGSLPTTAAAADVILTGESNNNYFGNSLAVGDFNADGKTDLAVGANGYSSSAGRAYVFYNGSISTKNASAANVILTGEGAGNYFSISLISGDFNADGKTDLAVGAHNYSASTGRAYVFYNANISTKNASAADVILSGEGAANNLGSALAAGDFNADGKTDLAVGAYGYSSSAGRVYIFYNGSISTKNASAANVILTGEASNNNFGYSLASGDFNADGKIDLAVGATGYSTSTGRAYIFHGSTSLAALIAASAANVILTGETTSNYFGNSLAAGDFNADGKTDLAVGAYFYSALTGRAYLFYNNNGIVGGVASLVTGIAIPSPAASAQFGMSLAVADFSGDGNLDLAVGASGASSAAGTFFIYPFEAGPNFQAPVSARGKVRVHGKVKFN